MGTLNLGNGANFVGGINGYLSDSPAGTIIQVVHQSMSNIGATSTTSTSLVETGLESTIIPKQTSSKILAIWTLVLRNDNNRSGIGLRRNSTDIWGYREAYPTSVGASNSTFQYLDSPNTTSAITYKVMFAVNAGSAGLSDVGLIYVSGTEPHSLTLYEIAQ